MCVQKEDVHAQTEASTPRNRAGEDPDRTHTSFSCRFPRLRPLKARNQSTYQTCLDLAEQYHLESIAFPSLSTGAFGYPLTEAATIALRTIIAHLKKQTGLKQVTVVLFGRQAYEAHERVLERLLF